MATRSPATDVAGARHAGWRAILLARDSETLDPTGALATILSLSELPALVSARWPAVGLRRAVVPYWATE